MSFKVEKISEPVVLGEGPHWDDQQQVLYYVSIFENTIHKYTPATGDHSQTKLDDTIGFIVPVEGTKDRFAVGLGRKLAVVQWDGIDGSKAEVLKTLAEVDGDKPTNRFNDGKVDPQGRLFAGTMGREVNINQFEEGQGSLYMSKVGEEPVKLFDKVGVSNGLAWDAKEKAFYYIDSLERAVARFDYDIATGGISNKRHVFDLAKNDVEGFPDGMTIDTDGNLWVAVYNGSSVIKVDPKTGKLLLKVPIPALQVTSVTFGGADLDVLFVTSAAKEVAEELVPTNGATFMVTGLGVKGYPNMAFKIANSYLL